MDEGEGEGLAMPWGIVYERSFDGHPAGPLPLGNLNAVAGRRYVVTVTDLGPTQ